MNNVKRAPNENVGAFLFNIAVLMRKKIWYNEKKTVSGRGWRNGRQR